MPVNLEDMYTIEDLHEDTAISLDNMVIYVNTTASGYHGLTEGYKPIMTIKEVDGEYIALNNEKITMLETTEDSIRYRHVTSNPYGYDLLEEYKLLNKSDIGKRNYVIKLLEGIAEKMVSFGGEEPYIQTFKGVLVGLQEGEPIGTAVIGETLIIQ